MQGVMQAYSTASPAASGSGCAKFAHVVAPMHHSCAIRALVPWRVDCFDVSSAFVKAS
jgi:hypothetical protein